MTASVEQVEVPQIAIHPRTRYTGAEIAGLDLSGELGESTVSAIVDALHEYGVVFFRNQRITEDQQIQFSRHFGNLEIHVLKQYTNPRHPEILILSNIVANGVPIGLGDAGHHWHSDTSYRREPDRGSILYAREIPHPHPNGETAGDTVFASAQAAYDGLDADMKKRLEGLKAVYSYINYYDSKIKSGSPRAPLTEEQKRKVPDVIHPIVRTHPFSGKKSIYVNSGHTVRIVDMSEKESEELLDYLYSHVARPEYIYRHKWQVGDVLMWDNCVVQHNAIGDYALPQRRLMHRTTIKGTEPF
jgi:taurine dioxygenase